MNISAPKTPIAKVEGSGVDSGVMTMPGFDQVIKFWSFDQLPGPLLTWITWAPV